jgi:uncharacterized membrane protein YkvA (DUF1232 family)
MKQPLGNFKPFFSENKLWNKLARFAKTIGVKTIYTILLLFYAYQQKDTPPWAKRIVIGALGYFISFVDAIPDLTPFIGFTDDIGVLGFGLVTIAAYINKDVRMQARQKLQDWFGQYDESDLVQIDQKL